MSDKGMTVKVGNLGCLTMIGVLLVAFKLAKVGEVATWSWWWVLSPFWIQPVIWLVFAVAVIFAAAIASVWKS